MNQDEILLFANALAVEKKVNIDVILGAIENTLQQILAKEIGPGANINVTVDPKDGSFKAKRLREVISDEDYDALEESFEAYFKLSDVTDHKIGDLIEEPMELDMLSRITAHNAKQIMSRLLRDLDREKTASKYRQKFGEIITASVKKLTKDYFVLETHDGIELMLARNKVIPKEPIRIGDRIKVCVIGINDGTHGPVVMVSRSDPEMLISLFTIEVPEIVDGAIEIKACAREPGNRAKIAVRGIDKRIDPIGACVGMKGIRVQSISNELNGERIDIINWSDDPARLAIAAISPAEVSSVYIDEQSNSIDLIVEEDQLSQAIGKSGQNIRLASNLIGWELNVKTENDNQHQDKESKSFNNLNLSEKQITQLNELGYDSPSALKDLTREEIISKTDLSSDQVEQIINNESDQLDITTLDTMLSIDEVTIINLESAGIHSVEDLSKKTLDEIKAIDGIDGETAERILAEAQLLI